LYYLLRDEAICFVCLLCFALYGQHPILFFFIFFSPGGLVHTPMVTLVFSRHFGESWEYIGNDWQLLVIPDDEHNSTRILLLPATRIWT
jgi:hypothetical protein